MSNTDNNDKIEKFKYLTPTMRDAAWGLTVTTAGCQYIPQGSTYPLSEHPTEYRFDNDGKRTLKEYQLIYITRGNGYFESASCPKTRIDAGTMFMLFPGEWHSYRPDTATGWDEHWIGFNGSIIDNMTRNGFFTPKQCIFRIGVDNRITDTFIEVYEIADNKKNGMQPLIAGLTQSLLGRIHYEELNHAFRDSYITRIINQAKTIIKDDLGEHISLEEIAEKLNISYSLFRREFKHHCGISPGQYRQELKIIKAKELLHTTNMSIAEIASTLHFECLGQFSTFFRKRVGIPPLEYRKKQ